MANSISDVTVNISVEDVINPAAFGIPLLLAFSDTAAKVDLDYTECYSIADVEAAVGDSLHKVNNSYKITAAEGESITGTTLSDTLHGITFKSTENFVVESNSKKYGETSFTKRVKSIEKGDLTVVPTSSDFISVYGICSSKDSTVDVVLFDADNNVEFARKSIGGEDISKVTFEVGNNHATNFYIYGESAESKTLHIYGIDYESASEDGEALIKAAETMFMQDNPPEKIAILAAGTEAFKDYLSYDWRQCVIVYGFDGNANTAIAEIIEAADEKKILFIYERDNSPLTKYKPYERTFVLVSDINSDWYEESYLATAALVANTCSKPVGSLTYKNQIIKLCDPVKNISKADLTKFHDANWNVLVTKAGYDVTSEGKTLSGEYLDIIDSRDWLITQIEYQLQQALIINDKIPYDNNGISLLENVVVNILQDAYNNGMIATDDDGNAAYTVDFAPRSETKASDRELRRYVEGNFTFDLAGAIHTVTVNGTIRI